MSDSPGERLRQAIAEGTSEPDRLARAVGEIVRASRPLGVDTLVVTGGAAVILATGTDFATRDIDLVTPDGDTLDGVLTPMGFVRRNAFQHIWKHEELGLYVQVAASFLPANSKVDEVEAPGGTVVEIWSTTDLVIDRLAQATVGGAPERLEQAVALIDAAGTDFDVIRARQRAAADGITRQFELLLALFRRLDEGASEASSARETFWQDIGDGTAGS